MSKHNINIGNFYSPYDRCSSEYMEDMIMKNFNAAILVVMTISMAFSTSIFSNLYGHDIQAHASSTIFSKSNKILEFSVYGESPNGNKINVTHAGGYVVIGTRKFEVMPWSYANFTEENMYVIYLANVTKSNFDIMFLYIVNSSKIVGLRHFSYLSATDKWNLGFEGDAIIFNREVDTPSVEMPILSMNPEAKISNKLFIRGENLYVVNNIGYMANGTNTLTIYPLVNIIDSLHNWNQLWGLLYDNSSNYYFSIFHMVSTNRSGINRGQTIRLNDYASIEHAYFNASWAYSNKAYNLTIEARALAPLEEFDIKIDGFGFKVEGKKITFPVSPGVHEIGVPIEFKIGEHERYVFDRWSDGISQNPRTIEVKKDLSLSVSYRKQFNLIVESIYSNLSRFSWFDYGETIDIDIPEEVCYDNGTRHIFVGWAGDSSSDKNRISVNMSSPKKLVAKWQTQYKVTFKIDGLASGSSIELDIDNEHKVLTVPNEYEDWYDSGTKIALEVDKDKYESVEWREESLGGISSPIFVDKPLKMTLILKEIKNESKITCQVDPSNLLMNGQVNIYGAISPPRSNKAVTLYYTIGNNSWNEIAETTTDGSGNYSYYWKPATSGIVGIRSSWPGNEKFENSTSDTTAIYISKNAIFFAKNLGSLDSGITEITEDKSPQIINRCINSSNQLATQTTNTLYSISHSVPYFGSVITLFVVSILLGVIFAVPILFVLFAILAYAKGAKNWSQASKYLLIIWLLFLSILTFIEVVFIRSIALSVYILFIFFSSILIAMTMAFAVDHFIFNRIKQTDAR